MAESFGMPYGAAQPLCLYGCKFLSRIIKKRTVNMTATFAGCIL